MIQITKLELMLFVESPYCNSNEPEERDQDNKDCNWGHLNPYEGRLLKKYIQQFGKLRELSVGCILNSW